MDSIVLSLGSNVGDRARNLQHALELLSQRGVSILKPSSLYETEAHGKAQPAFLNQVLVVDTPQTPELLLKTCLDIENDMGRVRTEKHGPRNIDIDVLFFKNQQRDLFNYQVPHRSIAERRFVLEPLAEVIPEQIHPVTKKTIQQMLDECEDELGVEKVRTNELKNVAARPGAEVHFKIPTTEPSFPISKQDFNAWIASYGEDPEREGLKDTYRRFVESRKQLYSGYDMDPRKIVTLFDSEGYDEMIICRDIDFFSTCEHHLLPFYGRAHIGYIPEKKILGISKFARVLEVFARRMQNQERLTTQVAEFLQEVLQPKGIGVILEAEHLCIKARGADKQNSSVTTSSFKGLLKKRPETRSEFLDLIAKSSA